MSNTYTANWDDARLINDCVQDFIKANFGDAAEKSETSVSVRPAGANSSMFNARVRTDLGQNQGHRMAVLKAIDTATQYYATEIHPKAHVNFD